ncbi:hypothetical protein H3143_02360 [Mycoplasma tullyi]|uniref:Uncharacterized protein n=1 Tax=Mycoplasma tullyi TaxID=1612150 RepID=A0A7D7UCT8_9MOLU|nr:hypothetical protein [Mycoplasma tullyi]QMT98326.1 hypothetical protein H3143_02360 [Mycoplasma tullyi]
MDHNKKKGRLISDALINRTEDFLIEEDDILSDEDIKKNDEHSKDGSFSESYNKDSFFNNEHSEPLHSTDRVLVTEEYDDEDLLNVPSEIIVPDKKHSKTATEYLSIEHITDLYSPNTGTFNTMSVHDVTLVKREVEIDPKKDNIFNFSPQSERAVPNFSRNNQPFNPSSIQKVNQPVHEKKVVHETDFEKLTTVEFKLEPTNFESNKLNRSLVPQSDPIKRDHTFNDHDLDFDSKTLDTLVSQQVDKNNIFEASSIIKEFNNKELVITKPNYRDDRIEKTTAIDFYLGDDDLLDKDSSFQHDNDDLIETDSKIQLSLENDPSLTPKKMTVNMQEIESDIDQITNGDKSNLYRYIKTGNSNVATANFLKQAAYKQEVKKSVEPKEDPAGSDELKMVLNGNDNRSSVFKQIDEQIKKEAQLDNQIKSRSYPTNYEQVAVGTRTESDPSTTRGRSRSVDSRKDLVNSRKTKNSPKKGSTKSILLVSLLVILAIATITVALIVRFA